MRNNQPVSQHEFEFPANATLMSTTDTQSHITYANAAFVAVSGFKRDEILGQPHNMVRHPDMPTQAFADMWATLRSGKSWTALVKNRRKNGDYYWVRANATPVVRGSQVTGYMSVRTKPSRVEIDATEALYREFRENCAGSRAFHQGLIVRTGWLRWTSALQTMPVRWRIRLAMFTAFVLSVAGAAASGTSGFVLLGFAAGAAVTTGAITAWLVSQIARPLEQIERQALCVAAGQPAENVNFNRVDEIGMILRAVNQSGLNLRSLVDDVSEQAGCVQTASSEMVQGNNDLSTRTEQAASNLQETAASMEQITSSVKNNADAARQAAQLAASASEAAAAGGTAVGQVFGTMQEITAASKKISDIISVIDGIAFQTNILALNAAVEAARAGEQGRGFAVVAGEVRGLAQRSAEAAKEIKTLIGNNVDHVEGGARQVDEAGRAMSEIVGQVQRVNELIAEISKATVEQSNGIGQVNAAVSQLDQIVGPANSVPAGPQAHAQHRPGGGDRCQPLASVSRTSSSLM